MFKEVTEVENPNYMIFDAIAIDDDPYAITDFMDTVKPITNLNVIGKFHSVSDALSFLHIQRRVNFIFSDIEMPGISGIEALKMFTPLCDSLIYVTGHSKYHIEVINTHSVCYLMKPVKVERIIDLIRQLTEIKVHNNRMHIPQFLTVKNVNTNSSLTIPVRDIICLIAWGNYVKVFTEKKDFLHYGPLIKMKRLLCKSDEFWSISQSCIVAKRAVIQIKGKRIRLSNGAEYKISRSRKASLSLSF